MGRLKHRSKAHRRHRRVHSRNIISATANAITATPKRKMIRRHPPILQTNSPFHPSLAVYRPASLFAMLLIASWTRNTFSLRWLALDNGCHRSFSVCDKGSLGIGKSYPSLEMSEWDGVQIGTSTEIDDDSLGLSDSTLNKLLESIPRGGADDKPPYSGLINLGNTCYLNAQLQCAYHVPLLRELVMNAKDEIVEVEVEVEGEELIDEQESDENVVHDHLHAGNLESEEAKTHIGSSIGDSSTTAKKTTIQQEIRPISTALRALQQTFHSLNPDNGHSAGSTQVLCRSLGINPYIQQDGQEFWKLFVPEVDYSKLTELYTGYYVDYIREIVPQNNAGDSEEKKEDDELMARVEEVQLRERVRTDPFLDLSIPITEGTGCSVEASLRQTFVQPEILRVSEGNGWRPSKGAEKVDAYKGLSLKRQGLPSLLQLHLKRFRYDWETGDTRKINDRCTFPLQLDLSEILIGDDTVSNLPHDDTIYDLQSVVVHRGEYGSGHYYSYVRPDIKVNKWYRFDDQVVTLVDYSEVIADAYGGKARRERMNSLDDRSTKQRRGILRRFFSFGGQENRGGFGYGGRTSSAYMIQYVKRSDQTKLMY